MGLFQERMSGGREKGTDRMSMVEDIHGLKTNLSLSLLEQVPGREKCMKRNVFTWCTIEIYISTKLLAYKQNDF